jgi:hypothetical protein
MNINDAVERRVSYYRQKIEDTKGTAEQIWAYISWSNLKEGYYTPNELIELSLETGFTVDSPYCKIKRGTEIAGRVTIGNGSSIDGENVKIDEETVLNRATILGSNIDIGKRNTISGPILPNNIKMGDSNTVRGLMGSNQGQLIIGNNNKIAEINIDGSGRELIMIGNHNDLHRGLNLNCSSSGYKLIIGNYNSLGRDGGGVVSTSYRFSKKWYGSVLIGNHVETTRGAEILGLSLLGWPLNVEEHETAKRLFTDEKVNFYELYRFFDSIQYRSLPPENQSDKKKISFFGTVKSKLCCLTGSVTAKDDTRIQSSYLKNVVVQERCKIYFSKIDFSESAETIRVDQQDIAIEHKKITQEEEWKRFPTKTQTSGYPTTANKYFEAILQAKLETT